MSHEISLRRRKKIEDNGNTLLQSYINTFNKEIEGNDSSLSEAQGTESPTLQITSVTGSMKLGDTLDIEQADENIVDDDNPNGTYFVDDQGRYYFSDTQQVITSVSEVITPDNEILLAEDSTNDILVEPPESYQTVTIVPSETVNGEVSYVLIVQQPEEKSQIDANPADIGNLTVYDFDDNEDLADENNDSGDEDDKSKMVSPKKQPVIPKPYMCTYCSYTTAKKYLLTRHMKSHSVERPHKCSVCSRGFKTLASLQNHLNTHTGTKPHKCRFCDSAFTTSGELVRHVRYRHTHEKPHKCNECEYASVELSKLKRHARCHTGERPYQCPHCTYASPDTFKLKRHLRTHTGEKPYECEYCHMCFTQSNSLKAHKLTHNVGDKPIFHCELCPTTCGRKTDLRIHVQKLHTADKPLKCRRCGKSYPDRYTFKMHNKTHEGEKCFKCEMCPYASTSIRHLSTHMLVHTDEKPYSCEKCDQTFRQKQLLKRHQNLYHNPEYIPPMPKEKSHECIQCGKHFRYKGNLIRHMATHDPESSIHEKSLALKLGRQRKIQLLNPQSTGVGFDGDGGNDNDVEMNYIVFEVIQAPEENSDGQVSLVSSKAYEDEDYDEGEEEEEELDEEAEEEEEDEDEEDDDDDVVIKTVKTKSKTSEKFIPKNEKDVENCFGFDDDEAEEEFSEERMTLTRDTLMKFGI